jgi:hypothetical protein
MSTGRFIVALTIITHAAALAASASVADPRQTCHRSHRIVVDRGLVLSSWTFPFSSFDTSLPIEHEQDRVEPSTAACWIVLTPARPAHPGDAPRMQSLLGDHTPSPRFSLSSR